MDANTRKVLEEAREAIAEHHVPEAAGLCINCDVLARIDALLAAPDDAGEAVAWQSWSESAGVPIAETHDPAERDRWLREGCRVRALYDRHDADLRCKACGHDPRFPEPGKVPK